MIIIGIILGVAAIGFLCWLLFSLAVYALPFFAALPAGMWAYHSNAGPVGAILVGIVAGAVDVGRRPVRLRVRPIDRGSELRSHCCSRRPPRSPATTRRSAWPS